MVCIHVTTQLNVGYLIFFLFAVELVNPTAAASFLDDVDNPRMYSLCQSARLSRTGYRKIVIKNYLIIYRIDDETKKVFIVRIVYGGRNYVDFI